MSHLWRTATDHSSFDHRPHRRVSAVPWRVSVLRWRLRLWGVWICTTRRGEHPIAELVARGEWAALDRLCALIDDAERER